LRVATMPILLKAENVAKRYHTTRSRTKEQTIVALDGVSLTLAARETLAIVGASGAGKSTLAMCLAGLEKPTAGSIWFEDQDLVCLPERQLRKVRPQIQLVFQDPALSLNPRMDVFEILCEPVKIQRRFTKTKWRERAAELLNTVGLSRKMLDRKPGEFSGGQRQRVAIARALALDPKLLILDESLSSLDPSVQAQIANLLVELRSSRALAMVFISHDPTMAAHLANEIAVMAHGKIVEHGRTREIVDQPKHAATRALLAALPGRNFGLSEDAVH
jgi:ABC-type glutathione transport system ATPase component